MNAVAEQLDVENLADLVLPEMDNAPQPSRPKVLLVLQGAERPTAGLLRAWALGSLLGGQLVVLRVLPEWETQPSSLLATISSVESILTESRDLRAWCDAKLPLGGEIGTVVRRGTFEVEAQKLIEELGAVLVVLSPETAGTGERAVRLSHQTRSPVLVARPARSNDAIVAATNLKDRSYPVLCRAATLGERLGSSLVFVHNTPGSAARQHAKIRLVKGPLDLFQRHERLRDFARKAAPTAETVMEAKTNTPEAILGIARSYDADLVVVGNHAPRGGKSVAARVIREARRSVLVVPLSGENTPAVC